jgi:hypothetical protein
VSCRRVLFTAKSLSDVSKVTFGHPVCFSVYLLERTILLVVLTQITISASLQGLDWEESTQQLHEQKCVRLKNYYNLSYLESETKNNSIFYLNLTYYPITVLKMTC